MKNTEFSLKTNIFSVAELTSYIKNLLESDEKLNHIFVRGEISNLSESTHGHIYFSLKDEESQIRCILFRKSKENLKFKLEHGLKIIVLGSIEVYKTKGEYSIIIEEIQPDGLGALNLAFIQLKNRLEKEGLFSIEHKKLIPKFPNFLGIITSPTGAALQDILNIVKRRYPLVKVVIAPTIVQGKEASKSIVESIQLMNELFYVDVIILGRGGGSLEELWCFNEEIVARAIFDSRIPIISAVGHETDFTIADFVADYRAPTPSAAAEKATPDMKELFETLSSFYIRCIKSIHHILDIYQSYLKQIINRAAFKRPLDKIHSYYREIDHRAYKLQNSISRYIAFKRKKLEIIESKVRALSPRSVLERGYSIVTIDNKIVKHFSDVKIDDTINVILSKGELDAKVKKLKED